MRKRNIFPCYFSFRANWRAGWAFAFLIAVFLQATLFAQRATATLSANAIETGDTFQLKIMVAELQQAPGKVDFSVWQPFFSENNILSGTGWTKSGAFWQRIFILIAFDSAKLDLPPLPIVLQNGKTIVANRLKLTVKTTTHSVEIADMEDIRGIRREPTLWWDYWPWMLGALIVALLALWLAKRKPKKVIAPPMPTPAPELVSPAQTALLKLLELEKYQSSKSAQMKVFCADISLITREYLEKRYQMPALESTTQEILADLKKTNFPASLINTVQTLLHATDLAKYAQIEPGPDFPVKALSSARKIIHETLQ